MIEHNFVILLYLLAGHALADYPLQGDWLSKAKNHKLNLIPGERIWPLALLSHSMIHALAVFLATQRLELALAEFFVHSLIDYAKCDEKLSYNQDQLMHLTCKLLWWVMLIS